jgi:molybdate transport system substrate-binding protein
VIALLLAALLAGDVVVFAAASLKESFEELGALFEKEHPDTRVRLNLAGSQELRTQLVHGAAADLFASADEAQMTALQGLALAPAIFARNEPVVIVPGDALPLQLTDLPQARRIVLGDAGVPIGAYSDRILARRGQAFQRSVEAQVVSRELNVRQVLAKVALGEADAAIVYRTDALAAGSKVRATRIPAADNVVAAYPIAQLRDAPHPALAAALLQLVLSARGRAVLERRGVLPP